MEKCARAKHVNSKAQSREAVIVTESNETHLNEKVDLWGAIQPVLLAALGLLGRVRHKLRKKRSTRPKKEEDDSLGFSFLRPLVSNGIRLAWPVSFDKSSKRESDEGLTTRCARLEKTVSLLRTDLSYLNKKINGRGLCDKKWIFIQHTTGARKE
uniref:Uncharacterized protein n=1 Tax=Acrobeloides nanus TaxID=290746 RepID=A0A914CGU3_9BILA